jgi:hypothetical protein
MSTAFFVGDLLITFNAEQSVKPIARMRGFDASMGIYERCPMIWTGVLVVQVVPGVWM